MKKQVKSGSLTKNVAQDGHGPWHPWASVGRMPQDATGFHRHQKLIRKGMLRLSFNCFLWCLQSQVKKVSVERYDTIMKK